MTKKLKALIAASVISTAAAGTTMGLYICEKTKKDAKHRSKDEILNEIVAKINALPNLDKTKYITKEWYLEHVTDHVDTATQVLADDMEDMQDETFEIFFDKLDDSADATKAAIDSVKDGKQIIRDEVQALKVLLAAELEELKSGVFGDHDLNYYKNLIEDSVRKSQFELLLERVDTIEEDYGNDIDNLIADVAKNTTDISTIHTEVAAIGTLVTGKIATDIDTLLTANANKAAIIAALQLDVATNSKSIEDIHYNLLDKDDAIAQIWSAIEAGGTASDTLITKLKEIQAHIDTCNKRYNLLETRVFNNEESIANLFISFKNFGTYLNDFGTTLGNLKSALELTEANLLAVKTDLHAISTEVKDMKSELIKANDWISGTKDTLATIMFDIQDLSEVVSKQDARIMNLETRMSDFENSQSSSSVLIYHNADAEKHPENGLTLEYKKYWNIHEDLDMFTSLEFSAWDSYSHRYISWTTVLQPGWKHDYKWSGEYTSFPKETEFGLKFDYDKNRMKLDYIYKSGNHKHHKESKLYIVSIRGIK